MCYCCVFVVLLLCYCCLLMCCCYLLFGYHCSVLSQSKADSLPQHRIELLTSSQVVKTEGYHCWFIFPNGGTEAYNCWLSSQVVGQKLTFADSSSQVVKTEGYHCWFIFVCSQLALGEVEEVGQGAGECEVPGVRLPLAAEGLHHLQQDCYSLIGDLKKQ